MTTKSTTTTFAPIVLALALVSGCAPLQQAPLVYSSKLVVGLDVSTSTTENPGFSVSAGVKSVDAAYVPVAVSKTVDSGTTNQTQVGITPISAQFGQGASPHASDTQTEENKTKITTYLKALQDANDSKALAVKAQADFSQAKTSLDSVTAALTSLQQATSLSDAAPQVVNPVVLPAGGGGGGGGAAAAPLATQPSPRSAYISSMLNPQLAALARTQPTIKPLGPVPDSGADLTPASTALIALRDSLAASLPSLQAAVNATASDSDTKAKSATQLLQDAATAANLLQTAKTDALSVYGRFDSNGTASGGSSGSATTTGLLVGKVFSTGLASQNLTEAAKIDARAGCLTKLFQLAGLVTDAAAKATFVSASAATCNTINSE